MAFLLRKGDMHQHMHLPFVMRKSANASDVFPDCGTPSLILGLRLLVLLHL